MASEAVFQCDTMELFDNTFLSRYYPLPWKVDILKANQKSDAMLQS